MFLKLRLFIALVVLATVVAHHHVASASSSFSATAPPPIFTVTGTHAEIGLQIGQLAKDRIKTRLTRADIAKQFLPFVKNTREGRAMYTELLTASNATFPQYVTEVQQLAIGADADFESIFCIVIQTELAVFMHEHVHSKKQRFTFFSEKLREQYEADMLRTAGITKPQPLPTHTHCTDVWSQPAVGVSIGGHNEDGGPGDKAINYFVNATVVDEQDRSRVVESFLAYAYAGTCAGYAWGMNTHGLIITENLILNLYQKYNMPPGYLFGRALLARRSISDALLFATEVQGAASGNVNLASFYTGEMVGFEYDAINMSIGVRRVMYRPQQLPLLSKGDGSLPTSRNWQDHTNMFQILEPSLSWPDESSVDRLAALGRHGQPNTTLDIRVMLGDTTNKMYPVYRNGTSPVDHGRTLTTSIFNLAERTVTVYDANPKDSLPMYRWQFSVGGVYS